MKTLFKRFSAVFLAVIMIAALAACGQADTPPLLKLTHQLNLQRARAMTSP